MGEKHDNFVGTQEKKQTIDLEAVASKLKIQLHKLDFTTRIHQINVAKICEKIGAKLGLSKEELSDLITAAKLHDIGKMAIPLEILNKPGKLTQEEYATVKRHCEIGTEILKNSEMILSERIIELVRNHHESLNGEGYPRGLKGDNLNKLCRILTVADKYEALTAKRPYKGYIDAQKTFNILADDINKGQIDASIVKVLKEIIIEKTISKDPKINNKSFDPEL